MTVRQTIRYGAWFLAILVVFSGGAVAVAIPGDAWGMRGGFITVALSVAAIILLLEHQSWGRLSFFSLLLLVAAFVVPIFLVPATPDTDACRAPPPGHCHGFNLNYHPLIRLALLAALLAAAIATALVGYARSRRT